MSVPQLIHDGAVPERAEPSYGDVVRAFQSVAEAMNDTRDLDPLLQRIADRVCDLLHARRCSIHLRDKASGLYRGRAANTSQAIDDRVKRLVLGMPADGFTREIVATKKPVVLINALSDPRAVRSAMREWNTRSVMGVPMLLRDEVIGLLIIDDEDQRTDYSQVAQEIAMAFAGLAASAIDQAQLNGKLRTTLETVARQNRLLRRASALEDELSALLIDGSSLQGTVDLVSKTTAKPCAIYTANLKRVVVAEASEGQGRMLTELVDTSRRESTVLTEALAELEDKQSGVIGPFAALGVHYRYLVVPVRRSGAVWGYLVVGEQTSRLSALDGVIALRAGSNVAVELSVQQRSMSDRWEGYESLASVLIRGSRPADWITQRADYLGVQLDVPRFVCVVAATGDGVAVPTAVELGPLLGGDETPEQAIGTTIEGTTVLLVESATAAGDRDDLAAAATALAAALDKLGATDAIVAGISRAKRSPAGTRAGYEEAQQIAACARLHVAPAGGVVLTADDIGVGRMMLSSTPPAESRRFVDETLGELAGIRTAKARELVLTLDAYLASRSVSQASKVLNVHENTVRYRLSRFEDHTGLDVLTDPDDHMTAYLAMLILRISGAIPGSGPVGLRIGGTAPGAPTIAP